MSTRLLSRSAVSLLALISAAACAASATAATTPLGTTPPADVSIDGRYVLLVDGTVLDRQTGAPLAGSVGAGAVDLAARSPKVLVDTDGTLRVAAPSDPSDPGVVASIDTQGAPVKAEPLRAFLVRDGAAVIFQTSETPARILSRDVAAAKTTLLATGATLLDASEDGRVITWSRELPAVERPGGTRAFDPAGGVIGTAVGYQVEQNAPRVVAVSSWTQDVYERPTPTTCPANPQVRITETTPWGLHVSQDGPAERYAFLLQTTSRDSAYPPYTTTLHRRVGSGEPRTLLDNGFQRISWFVRTDPASGAVSAVESRHGSPFRSGTVFDDAGGSRTVAAPSGGEPLAASSVLAYDRGASAITTFTPLSPGTDSSASFVDEGGPLGPTGTPWTTLPRATDPVDGPVTRADITWARCDADDLVVRGTLSDYAAVAPATTRNSAGSVRFTPAPDGKITAKSLGVQLTWAGIRLWSKTVPSGPVTLPSILPFVPGYRTALRVTLADGTTVTGSVPLWRSR